MTLRARDRLRKRAGAAVVDSFFKGAARLGGMLPPARPEIHAVERIRDVAYADGAHRLQHLDVWRPVRPPPHVRDPRTGLLPAIVYVHGGGFRMLDKDSHWLPALVFARRGYVVFNVSYRLAPAHPFPAAIEDVAAAWRWVAANARRFGADPDRVGLAGESAGANLATALTLCAVERRPEPWAAAVFDTGLVPRAVLPAMGLLQVSDPARFGRRRPMPRFVLDRVEEVTEAYLGSATAPGHELADPLLVLEADRTFARPLPPFHACCGTADPVLDDTRRLAEALGRRGVEHHTSYWPGGVHAFHMFVFQSDARAVWKEILEFAHRHVARVDEPVRPLPWIPPIP